VRIKETPLCREKKESPDKIINYKLAGGGGDIVIKATWKKGKKFYFLPGENLRNGGLSKEQVALG